MTTPLTRVLDISASMRSSWRVCPRTVFYKHIAAVRSLEGRRALAIGSAFHAGIDTWRRDPNRDKTAAALEAVSAFRYRLKKERLPEDSYSHHQVFAYVVGYCTFFGERDRGTIAIESQVFEDGIGETGYTDSVLKYPNGSIYIVEDKTTQRFDDADEMRWALKFNDQLSAYTAGLRGRGEEIHGALYRQVKKTQTKQTQKETPDDYRERIIDIYTDPVGANDLFREFAVHWSEDELKRLNFERERTNLDILSWLDKLDVTEWPYNPSACIGVYGPCEFLRLCANNRDGTSRCFESNGRSPIDGGRYQERIWSRVPTKSSVSGEEGSGKEGGEERGEEGGGWPSLQPNTGG